MIASHSQSAFSLVGIAVIMAVLSIATGLGLSLTDTRRERSEHYQTTNQLQEIRTAIEHFYDTNGRLPCPASRTEKLGDATFGQEILSGSCDGSATEPAGTVRLDIGAGVYVRFGSLPTRNLMLRDTLMVDAYGTRITYAVMEDLTSAAAYSGASATLTVNNATGSDLTTSAAYVLVSHGDDSKGGFSLFGNANQSTCSGSNPDVENCDDDATFSRAAFDLDIDSADYFDDLLIWEAKY